MSKPGSTLWFARHEFRLAWRDAIGMMSAGRQKRARKVLVGAAIFVAFLHYVAFLVIGHLGQAAILRDVSTLIVVTAGLFLAGTAMISQTMESVTRSFYTRSDLELILSSPARARRLFAVRIAAIAVFVGAASVFFLAPIIDVLAFEGGIRWLAAYGVIISLALVATSIGVGLTVFLFRTIGPSRTRLAAQICAAVIGAIFVIGLQVAAMFSIGTLSRFAFLRSQYVIARAPGVDSAIWRPAYAALGDPSALLVVIGVSLVVFFGALAVFAPQFDSFAISAWGASRAPRAQEQGIGALRVRPPEAALRRKEIILLMRDPWLLSQSLMQLLYLLPPALLLSRSFAFGIGAVTVLVPVLIMAAGQLAGGLAWLTISGEDAPDLVLTAPITQARLWRAKLEAVTLCIAAVFSPFVLVLLFVAPGLALISVLGIGASATSAAAIQFWFRSQAKRSNFRRRFTSSRIATFSEAFSSISWAATGAIAATGSVLASVVALASLGILGIVRLIAPTHVQST